MSNKKFFLQGWPIHVDGKWEANSQLVVALHDPKGIDIRHWHGVHVQSMLQVEYVNTIL